MKTLFVGIYGRKTRPNHQKERAMTLGQNANRNKFCIFPLPNEKITWTSTNRNRSATSTVQSNRPSKTQTANNVDTDNGCLVHVSISNCHVVSFHVSFAGICVVNVHRACSCHCELHLFVGDHIHVRISARQLLRQPGTCHWDEDVLGYQDLRRA